MAPLDRVEIFVPGRPVAQGSMRVFRGHATHPRALLDWRETVAGHAQVQLAAHIDTFPVWPVGPLALVAIFALAVPPGRKHYDLYKHGPGVPDHDKLLRAICDALEGIVYANDAQIADGRAIKVLAGRMEPRLEEGVTIKIAPWEESGA